MIFRHKHTIEAIQLTADLALSCLIDKQVAPFGLSVSGHYHPERREVYWANVTLNGRPLSDGGNELSKWIVKDAAGHITILTADEFQEKFEAAAPVALMRKALRAHRAWHAAEDEIHRNLTTFNERMVLCNFAQWLTAKVFGHAEDYNGVPRLVVIWPRVEIRREEVAEAEALVERIMAAVEAAMTTPPATPWPGAVVGRVNQAALIEEEERVRREGSPLRSDQSLYTQMMDAITRNES